MAVTPTTASKSAKQRAWHQIIRSMGYRDLGDMIDHIVLSAGTPDTELTSMDDYCFVYDTTNNIAYFHTTGATFPAIGQGLEFAGGHKVNPNTVPNAEEAGLYT